MVFLNKLVPVYIIYIHIYWFLRIFPSMLNKSFYLTSFPRIKSDPTLQAMGKIVDDFSRCRYIFVLSILMSESMLRG
jgi:hypothetical protein